MSLITCPECGREIPAAAESCPGCGCPTALFAKLARDKRLKTVYPLQEGDGFALGVWGGRSIRWRVLKVDGDRIFAISGKALDCRPFNHADEKGNDWDTSDLKAWLERVFLNGAFIPEHRALIQEVTCLSSEEAEELFEDDEERSCKPTAYAHGRGAFIDSDSGGCNWWLRSPGTLGNGYIAYVWDDGGLDGYGTYASDSMTAVRPALRLRVPEGGLPAPLNICPACAKQVSEYAAQCPDCGCPQTLFPGEVGNRFELGRWDGQSLRWRTVAVDGNRILAVSMAGLTCKPFNRYRYDSNDWDSSDLCRWLNETFPLLAFSAEERARIREVTCLSVDEAEELFEDDGDRLCEPSAQASREGVTTGRVTGGCDWWLRSPGLGGSECATFVNFAGYVGKYGCRMDHTNVAVRPAIWLEL